MTAILSRHPYARVLINELEAAGVREYELVDGGKHKQLRWVAPTTGTARLFTFPSSPSDWRGVRNSRSDVRKLLIADGLITREAKIVHTRMPSLVERLAKIERDFTEINQRIARLEQALSHALEKFGV